MKKILITLTILCLSTVTIAQLQNSIWSFPSQYGQDNGGGPILAPLPQLPGTSTYPSALGLPNYQGATALTSHNAMQDAQGNLLFYIVDYGIYDKNGETIDNLIYAQTNELCIVPDPANCMGYYIFYDWVRTVPDPPTSQIDYYAEVNMSYLDLSVPYLNTGNSPLISFNNFPWLNIFYSGFNHYAASKLRLATNDYFVYSYINSSLVLTRIDATGHTVVNAQTLTGVSPLFPGAARVRAEMELVEYTNTTTNQPQYKIAIPFSVNATTEGVYYAEIDYATGNIIAGTEKTHVYPSGQRVKGLEFSPNTDYLYVSHTGGNYIEYFDLASPTFAPINMNLYKAIDFQYSQIELAADGKLYFAGRDNSIGINYRFATIGSPNTPAAPLWNDNALASNNYTSNTGWYSLPEHESYVMPDQIDGMDYTDHFNTSTKCCIDNSRFDVAELDRNNEFSTSGNWSYTGTNPWNATSGSITVRDKMIIKSGTNVTITGMTFEFATNAQLIVERGANLTLDNCTLTVNTTCNPNAMWHGVEVWGTTGAWQPIPSNRGSLITKNNTLIEHAIVATANARHNQSANNWPIRNSFAANYTGGIIKSTNTIFRNNVVDTQFETFISTNGNNTYNDLSYFRNCHFLTDALLNNNSLSPFAHAFLRRVKGIKFQGCTFENTATSQYIVQQRGRGIYALESLFSVKELCNTPVLYPNPCPIANADPCEFNNLTYGIIGTNLGNRTRTAQIMNNTFINNFRGIYIRNMDLAEITNNYMEVGADLAPNAPAYGMYFDGCDKYKVENNRLHNVGGTFGMYTINSGGLSNEIYRNDFYSFKTACQAAGKNGFGTTHPYAPIGLEYRCNYYSETVDYDILVSSGRIKSYQGNCSTPIAPANNRFSYTASQGDYWVNNAPSTSINSRYRFVAGNTLAPRSGMFNPSNTIRNLCGNLPAYDLITSCPKKVKKTKSDLVLLIGNLRVIIDSLTAQIDGGNTQSLITTINTEPAWKVKNELLAASPNLSDEVLLALLNSNMPDWVHQQVLNANTPLSDEVFLAALDKPTPLAENIIRDIAIASSPLHTNEQLALLQHTPKYADWLLKEVLIENSPLKDEVLIALMDKTPVVAGWAVKEILLKNTPLSNGVNNVMNTHTPNYPNWMINQVNNSTFVADEAVDELQPISPMIELSEEIGYYQAESDKLSHDLLRIFLFDEEETDATIGDAIAFLDSSNCANSQCLLTCAYIDNGNYGAAQQTVNALSTDSANAAYCTLFNTVIQYEQMAQYEQELLNNGTLLNNVQSVANGTTQNPEVGMAAAILEAVYNQDFQETFEYVNNNNSQRTAPINKINNTKISQVNIYPNPTKEQFTLSHNYALSNGNLVIIVYDVMGRALISEQITTEQQVVNTTALKQGVYFYQVTQNNKNLSTGKLVIE